MKEFDYATRVRELLPERSLKAGKFAAFGGTLGAIAGPRAAAGLAGLFGFVGAKLGERQELAEQEVAEVEEEA